MARRYDDDDRDRDDEEEDRPRKKKKKKGPSAEEKQMAMFCHLGALIGGFVIPLVIWMMKKEDSRFVDRHGRESLNFAISLFIYYMIGGPLTCGLIILILGPLSIYWCVMGGMAASRGERWEYPMTIRFL